MKNSNILTMGSILLITFGISGCVTNDMPNIDSLPICIQGKKNKIYKTPCMIKIPKGSPVSFKTSIKGKLFRDEIKKSFSMTLNKEIYLYIESKGDNNKMLWVSYDKKTWKPLEEAFHGKIDLDVDANETGNNVIFSVNLDPAI